MLKGYLHAFAAYISWGLFPIYWKLLEGVSSIEVLAHRIIWSVPFIMVLFVLSLQTRNIWSAWSIRRQPWKLLPSALVITINWGVYIWAVNHEKVIEASMGYFLTPVFNVLFGYLFFRESINLKFKLSVLLAFAGVICQFIALGYLPWVSLILGVSFALYGAIRKSMAIDAMAGLYVETVLMLPVALIVSIVLMHAGEAGFLTTGLSTDILLVVGGVVTAIPLLMYVKATRVLPMSTMGIMFFITPSMQLMIGLFLYHEVLERMQWLGFILIWCGLILFIFAQRDRHAATSNA